MEADDDLREEIRAASLACDSAYPRAAELLRALAAGSPRRPATTHNRRRILRALHNVVYARFSADPASQMIAAAWSAWEQEPTEHARIGTAEYYFQQLAALGYRRVAARTVFEDLTS